MKRIYLLLFCIFPFYFAAHAQSYIINTFAGTGTAGFSGDGGAATSAEENEPWGVAVDKAGNVYIAEYNNQRVRKVSTSGIITTIAGNGSNGFSGDGGPATIAELNFPTGVAVDTAGNIYIADENNQRIRKINTAGIISTYAGTGGVGFSGDGGPATSATFDVPEAVAIDKAGNLYIADFYNYSVRKVNASGIISTLAGNQSDGFSGDGGLATAASMGPPLGVGVDKLGNVYIGDESNARVRIVNPAGIINTFAGNGVQGYFGDGGYATAAELSYPYGVCSDTAGNIYIADYNNARIRFVTPDGIITTIAGDSSRGYTGDGGPATQAELSNVSGVAINSIGNVFIADLYNNCIRKLTLDTVNPKCTAWNDAGPAGFSAAGAATVSLAISGGTPYIAFTDAASASALTVMNYTGTAWQTTGTTGFSAGAAYGPSLAFSGATPYVAYQDAAHGSKATAMQYNGTAWTTVGTAGFSAGYVSYVSLAMSGATPYVAYQDQINFNAATVMEYTGGTWQAVGTAGFTAGQANYTSLAIWGSTPYLAFSDGANSYKASAMMYNGSSWQIVGTAGFSAGYAYDICLAFDNAGNPYVAYEDASNSSRATVMEYTGGTWQVVGTAGFSAGTVQHPSLAFAGATPYIAYEDMANGDKVTVMEYTGGVWKAIGAAGFSAGAGYAPSLALSGTVPYVGYQDVANADKATVMDFMALTDNVTLLSNVTCNGNNNGSASVSASGGKLPYTYLWSPGGNTNAIATGLSAGTYTVTLNDNVVNGCNITKSITITQPAAGMGITLSAVNTVSCNSSAWVKVSGGVPPYTYSWTPAANSSDSVSHLCPGEYCCKVTDRNGCTDSICVSITATGISNLKTLASSINVYPNPSGGIFTFAFSHPELVSGSQTIEVYNMLGQPVYNATLKQVQGDYELNLATQSNGVYMYRVLSENGELTGEGKLIIQK